MKTFHDIDNFYPTPPHLAKRMLAVVEGYPVKILDPSAGKADLIDAVSDHYRYAGGGWGGSYRSDIYAIEIDPTLQATLRGKNIKVLDSDFLAYTGPDKFDLIIANPPFADGDKHLLQAIEIMYRGQIVFLLNAETIRNPHTKTRKLLARKLKDLGAKIKYYKNGFTVAERKTKVEVALIHIKIDRAVDDDLFAGCADHGARAHQKVEEQHEVATGRTIPDLVAAYNQTVQVGTEVILNYFQHYKLIGKYLGLNAEAKCYSYEAAKLTELMQNTLNDMLVAIRTDYWRRTLNLTEVKSRLTSAKQKEFEHALNERCHMDFTESNIRQFVMNIIGSYEQTLTGAVIDIFDMFTRRHSWREGDVHEQNIHYFNGWKTNNAFKVGERVVIPVHSGSYGEAFFDAAFNRWSLDFGAGDVLRDIDTVMNYFDGMREHVTLQDAVNAALDSGTGSGQSTYFKFRCHKKGTIHLTFLDEDILRRFNLVACRGKGWLPQDYGVKPYRQLTGEERAVAEGFDGGETAYGKHRDNGLDIPSRPQIAA